MEALIRSPQWPPLEDWRHRRRLAPIAWLGGPLQVPQLAGKRMYWFTFPALALAARETLETLVTTERAFEAVMLLAQATGEVLAGGSSFRAQIMDLGIREDRRDRFIFHGKPVNQLNGFVTAFNPWNWREPHHFDAGHPISLRVVNLSTLGANTVNISIFGYSD